MYRRNVPALLTICLDCSINNLSKFTDNNLDLIQYLPDHIKDQMLRKFTVSSYFWANVDFKKILECIVHKNTEHINLTSCNVHDDLLNIIKSCENLKKLHLSVEKNSITTQALTNTLSKFKNLILLRISYSDAVNDDVVECVSQNCKVLKALDFGYCTNITDNSMPALGQLKHLQYLTLSKTQITNWGIECVLKGPSGFYLKELKIAECINTSETVFNLISKYSPNIEILVFYNCGRTQDENSFSFAENSFSLKHLKQLKWTIEW